LRLSTPLLVAMLFGATLVVLAPAASADTCTASIDPYLLCADYYAAQCYAQYMDLKQQDVTSYAKCMRDVALNAVTGGPPQ
jgi:hypothetical protein